LLAGRKLLLADDSITIQKVVDLTFADEGVNVLCVGNGREAIEALAEFSPDVVLADVFMPEMNGYEVCEYIKHNDKFKHIPVMLLVGSFEPFDEQEARRVGANDTLTKPFQSIRRLIEKVGLLSSNRPSEEQIATAELPHAEEPPVEKLTTAEIEITTADTQPLRPGLRHVVEDAAASRAQEVSEPAGEPMMNSQAYEGAGEVLLDLGDFRQGPSVLDDEFVLDIDLDESPEPSPAKPAFSAAAFPSRESYRSLPQIQPSYESGYETPATIPSEPAPTTVPLEKTTEYERVVDDDLEVPVTQVEREPSMPHYAPEAFFSPEPAPAPATEQELSPEPYGAPVPTPASAQELSPERYVPPVPTPALPQELSPEPSVASATASAQQLSPEMIDAIARRAVEQLSEKVIQEIAWEVVPQLAELLIKRQLEEKNS
jgi:CheY-like chemotaxis protein